uniref:Uncharacterized protein n=1 Tax=Opuntia streptacantha TaxID=393608 RepID=A0A7C9EMD6_OPUST
MFRITGDTGKRKPTKSIMQSSKYVIFSIQMIRFIFKLELSASIFRQKNSVSFFKTHRDELPFSGTSPRPNSNHFPGVKLVGRFRDQDSSASLRGSDDFLNQNAIECGNQPLKSHLCTGSGKTQKSK